ncbi:MAG: hypothetical protein U9N04_00515 [Patescibacteria group bacterium]|nr:hypothetical protein [Patescibacteria group bacterium]
MIFLVLLSIIFLVYSFVFYRQRQYQIAKPLFAIGAVLMIATIIVWHWAASRPYP